LVDSPEIIPSASSRVSRTSDCQLPGKTKPQVIVMRGFFERAEKKGKNRGEAVCVCPCYDFVVFNFGKPQTLGDWIVHIAGAIVAVFLVWWMLKLYVL
jgi:predicted cupin superfamily sugar epimerase